MVEDEHDNFIATVNKDNKSNKSNRSKKEIDIKNPIRMKDKKMKKMLEMEKFDLEEENGMEK